MTVYPAPPPPDAPPIRLIRESNEPAYDRVPHVTIIEDDVLDAIGSSLGPVAYAVYTYLERRCGTDGTCFPTQYTIAEALCMSERHVKRAIAQLRGAGWIIVTARTNAHGAKTSNVYTLPNHLKPRTYAGDRVGDRPGDCQSPKVVVSSKEVKEYMAERQKPTDERFEQFWSLYPRKVKKKTAQDVWQKANPDEATIQQIMQAVGRWTASKDWQADDGKYIPHPATWLNQERWEDEFPEPAPPKIHRVVM